jgi:hypothetical protein
MNFVSSFFVILTIFYLNHLAIAEPSAPAEIIKCEFFSYRLDTPKADEELRALKSKKDAALKDFDEKNSPAANLPKHKNLEEALERAKRPEFQRYLAGRDDLSRSFDRQIIELARSSDNSKTSSKYLEFTTELGTQEKVLGTTPQGQASFEVKTSRLANGDISGAYAAISSPSNSFGKSRSTTFIARLKTPSIAGITNAKINIGGQKLGGPGTAVDVVECSAIP